MPAKKIKEAEIRVYLTGEQKNQLKRMAEINVKSLSEYLLNAGLSLTLDAAKMDFYQSINSDLAHIKKSQLVTTRLLLLLGARQLNSEDEILRFYNDAISDAEKRFREG